MVKKKLSEKICLAIKEQTYAYFYVGNVVSYNVLKIYNTASM
jgi:hypothetical protein